MNAQAHLSQSVMAHGHKNQSKGCSGQQGFTLLHVSMQLFKETTMRLIQSTHLKRYDYVSCGFGLPFMVDTQAGQSSNSLSLQ